MPCAPLFALSWVSLWLSPPVVALEPRPQEVEFFRLEEVLQRNPGDFKARYLLVQLYDRLGLLEFSRQELEICKAAGRPFYEYLLNELRSRVAAADFKGANQLFPYVERHYPEDPSVLLTRALRLHAMGERREAVSLVERLEKNGQYQYGMYSYLGEQALERKSYGSALELFEKELSTRPDSEIARVGKAKALEGLGRHAEALGTIRPVFSRNSLFPRAAEITAVSMIMTGDKAAALLPALVSVAFSTREETLRQAKARLRYLWGTVSPEVRARMVFDVGRSIERAGLWPYASYYHFALGDVLKKLGENRLAAREFLRGLAVDPGHVKAYLHLGDLACRGRDYARALDYYRQGKAMYIPERSLRREFQSKVARLEERMGHRPADTAWRLKDRLKAKVSAASKEGKTGGAGAVPGRTTATEAESRQ